MSLAIPASIVGTAAAVLFLLNFTTGEKKIDREIAPLYDVADPQFRRTMGTLLGPPLVDGNRLTAFQNGDEIFPAMLAAIRSARRTITLETYIYWSGTIGREFADALGERAKAGVEVRWARPTSTIARSG